MKKLMTAEESTFAELLARLASCNHFLPERIELEREALGPEFVNEPSGPWNLGFATEGRNRNVLRLAERAATLVATIHERLRRGDTLTGQELQHYESLVGFHLYQRYRESYHSMTKGDASPAAIARAYEAFSREIQQLLEPACKRVLARTEIARQFAVLWQLERAFVNIFANIVGSSASIARLRAAVWESIFTCNFKRYRDGLLNRMHEITTLITGPSGTGKELVAKAIACSAYIPFDPAARQFRYEQHQLFLPLNLAALSASLIESELFGHRRGAFTGAVREHAGWLEVCPPGGSVFLDEIGEIDGVLQVKLLRILQIRSFNRLGESRPRSFAGKIIAATNRDLKEAIAAGRFREDFYYRICSDLIVTPSLREQLDESPEDLRRFVRFVAGHLLDEEQAEELSDEVVTFVDAHLGRGYAWPGNFRELEQCVRNILVRGTYEPLQLKPFNRAAALVADLEAARLTADELVCQYCAFVYAQTKNIEETGRRLNLDGRTVKAKLFPRANRE